MIRQVLSTQTSQLVGVNNSSCNFPAHQTGDKGNALQALNNSDSTRSTTYVYDVLNRIPEANTVDTFLLCDKRYQAKATWHKMRVCQL